MQALTLFLHPGKLLFQPKDMQLLAGTPASWMFLLQLIQACLS
jgi:hypothetical protein